ncbi:hypothetical protein [Flavobacterium humidisoli]|uniref:YARHG domain-containing protein n=1 Tax=Flavobacterium humidisoli TaxID=2937442 RepID=A0ABY4LT75_9FLAO|nr:hypothetical protein [Flavobacterium humidisoli]UPZ15538.1 hypothetical protein M0M44_22660 [Flavobacterium humidisoli]
MKKITQEDIENDYKEAIREKYRVEKSDGKYSHYLSNPSQALLRDLCWEIFNAEPKADDLAVYRTFFKAEFVPKEVDTSQQYTDKFKKVGAFFKAERETAKISTVDLAAILVDFENRPFRKFVKKGFEPDFSKNEINSSTNEKEIKELDVDFVDENFEKEAQSTEAEVLSPPLEPKSTNIFIDTKEKILQRFKEKLKKTIIAITLIFGLVTTVVYFAFFKKHCMQWTGNHYEVVDCTSHNESSNLNEVIPLDKDLLDFRKITACDTTKCFLTNGEAIVWYGKTANGIDFFNDNGNGWHPENRKALRPMTDYMFKRYLKGKPCK